MEWYQGVAMSCLAVCIANCLFHFYRLIRLGKPKDYSCRTGNIEQAVFYSFTGAMSPVKKESAFLHLPTYTAGMIYHLGTFLAFFLCILLLFPTGIVSWLRWVIFGCLMISGSCGVGILIKRFTISKLRSLSNPDDYLANLLVTAFQLLGGVAIISTGYLPAWFILSGLLFLYIPLSKLKHMIYFFAARFQLGFFYGWRNVWPPNNT